MRLLEYASVGERLYHETLENGLNIFIIDKPDYVNGYACFATNYGGSDRRFKLGGKWIDTPAGVAHFLEHKMFDMPDGSNTLAVLSANGAAPNAYTSSGITNYHFTCSEKFEENLRVLLNYVSTPYFTEESVKKEQGIIGQEIKMCEDYPDTAGYMNLLKLLYKENPSREHVVGTLQSISEITPQVLYDCHKVFYNPSNMVLVAAGNVDKDRVVEIAREIVTAKAGELPERDYGKEDSFLPYSKRVECEMEVAAPLFTAGAKLDLGPDSGEEYWRGIFLTDFASAYLTGKASKLYSRMYESGIINKNFGCGINYFPDGAIVIVAGESREPDRVLSEIFREAKTVSEASFDSKLFRNLKNAMIGACIKSYESLNGISNNMASCFFKGFTPFRYLEMYESITERDVIEFISEYYREEKFALSLVNPIKK